MSEANKEIVRREIEEIINGGHDDLVDELLDEDYVLYAPFGPEPFRGRKGFRASLAPMRAGLPDLHVRIDDQLAAGDKVVTRWTLSGRHDGEFFGIPPSGRRVSASGITIERLVDGRVVEDHMEMDALGLMRQLGAVPEPVG